MAQEREWLIEQADYETVEDFRIAVANELAALENMGHRTGRGFTVSPVRVQQLSSSGLPSYVTKGWLFREVFMPAARAQVAEEPDVVVDAELVGA